MQGLNEQIEGPFGWHAGHICGPAAPTTGRPLFLLSAMHLQRGLDLEKEDVLCVSKLAGEVLHVWEALERKLPGQKGLLVLGPENTAKDPDQFQIIAGPEKGWPCKRVAGPVNDCWPCKRAASTYPCKGGGGGLAKGLKQHSAYMARSKKKQPRFKALARPNLCLPVATAESKSVEPKLV